VVFFQIDCFIPKDERFWELFSPPNKLCRFKGREGYRVKSIWYGKFLSQGLVFPVSDFPEINRPYKDRVKEIGVMAATEELLDESFADLFGVEKWEFESFACNLPHLGRTPDYIQLPRWWRIQDVERAAFSRKSKNKTW
jgi:hypothetical protein